MSRKFLRTTLSAAALLAGLSHSAMATTAVPLNGGGATAQAFNFANEFATFNAAQSLYAFGTYYSISSGTAQTGFVTNAAGLFNAGSTFAVDYTTSEYPLSSSNYAVWTASSNAQGQASAGNLIQVPVLGTAVPIVVVNSAITANGKLQLTDDQLCGIFSGKMTNWNQVSAPATGVAPAAGQITVVYRNDTGGTTYNLSNHLAKVCNGTNSNFAPGFAPSNTFSAFFTGGVVPGAPASFVGVKGNLAVANYLSSIGTATPTTSAVGYTSPDYTSIAPNPDGLLGNGLKSTLLVAGLKNGTLYYTPTVANIAAALNKPGANATNLAPPSAAIAAANPLNWVPSIPTPGTGYAIVGYSNLFVPQCYKDANVAKGVIAFLKLHYGNAAYFAIENNNGLVKVANTGSAKFLAAIKTNILADGNAWHVNIQNATACAGIVGR